MTQRRRGLDRWVLVPLAVMAAIAAVDRAVGPDVVLIALLIAGPLLAAFRLDVAHTAAVAIVALLLSVLLGIENQILDESGFLTRLPSVALAGALSVWLARLRIERERAALLLAVQGSVSRILNESRTLAEAAPRLLRGIGEALEWEVGAVWQVDDESRCVRRVEGWSTAGFEAPSFEALSRAASFARGEGLPGQVWDTGLPVSLPDYGRDPGFPRAHAAGEGGLEAAFAFPLRGGLGVVGVIEFLSTERRVLDASRLETFAGLGRQIGQFIERRRSEEQRAELLGRERAARRDAERAELGAAETVALLDTLLARAPVGFAFVDPELRCLRVNDALATIGGNVPGELVGRPVDELLPDLARMSHNVRRVLEQEAAVTDVEVSGRTTDADAERHWIQSCYPVRGVRGEILGVGVLVVEITERKRAETRANFLSEATAALTASLDYEVTLTSVARLTVPQLADWCIVDVVDPDSQRIKRLAVAHSDPDKERLMWELDRDHPDKLEDPGPAAAIRSGAPQLHRRVDDALLTRLAKHEAHLRALRELGFASAMAVPLRAGERIFGAITFASAESRRVFDEGDLALAEEVATRAAVAIENARLYRERSHIARTLQASLLPPRLPEIPGIELAARYRAAGEATDVGGDFYDVFPTGERTWGAVVGDVLGKGAGAAAMIGLARHTLRAAAMREPDSASILSTLNEALYRESVEESFCTAVYLAIELADDVVSVELTCAGHPLPLVLRGDGVLGSAGRPGTLLGAIPRLALAPQRVTLGRGDTLVAYTDGVVEARSEQEVFGEQRLRSLLANLPGTAADGVAERIAQRAIEFQAGRPHDDLAVLVVRRPLAAGDPIAAEADPGDRIAAANPADLHTAGTDVR